jgi:hypothetical protein
MRPPIRRSSNTPPGLSRIVHLFLQRNNLITCLLHTATAGIAYGYLKKLGQTWLKPQARCRHMAQDLQRGAAAPGQKPFRNALVKINNHETITRLFSIGYLWFHDRRTD